MINLLILFQAYLIQFLPLQSDTGIKQNRQTSNLSENNREEKKNKMLSNSYNRQTSYSQIVTRDLENILKDSDDGVVINTRQNKPLQAIIVDNSRYYERPKRKSNREDTNERTVYVNGLDPSDTDESLVQMFRQCKYDVAKVTKKNGNTYGYVTFQKKHQATEAIERASFQLGNHVIRVMAYNPPEAFDPNANLIIKNFPSSVDESQLKEKFARFGRILSCKVERLPDGRSRGFGYVQFDNERNASNAITELNNTYWDDECDPDKQYLRYKMNKKGNKKENGVDLVNNCNQIQNENRGKKIFVGKFRSHNDYYEGKKAKEGKESNLYVTNLGYDFGDRDLYFLFNPFGVIKSAKIRRNKDTNAPMGCGFVDFEYPEDAEHARQKLDGHILKAFGNRVITVRFANCKSRRQRRKEEQLSQQENFDYADAYQYGKKYSIDSISLSERSDTTCETNNFFDYSDYDKNNNGLFVNMNLLTSNMQNNMFNDNSYGLIGGASANNADTQYYGNGDTCWTDRFLNMFNATHQEYKLFN